MHLHDFANSVILISATRHWCGNHKLHLKQHRPNTASSHRALWRLCVCNLRRLQTARQAWRHTIAHPILGHWRYEERRHTEGPTFTHETGETTRSLMWRIVNGNDLAGVPATVAFVSIGTNNLKQNAVHFSTSRGCSRRPPREYQSGNIPPPSGTVRG